MKMTDGDIRPPIAQPSQPSPSRASNPPKNETRRYGFACYNCRRRKAKCDGAFPTCRKCVVSRETCNYDRKPSVAYAVTLQYRLEAYQARFDLLRRVKDNERDALLAQPIIAEKPKGGKARAPSPTNRDWEGTEPHDDTPNSKVSPPSRNTDSFFEEMSVGADGEVCFYGRTSLYHIKPPENCQDDVQIPNVPSPNERTTYDNKERRKIDEMRTILSEIPPTTLNELLDTYWCWPHHLHCVLVKKLFLRDLSSPGPYISPFLLSAVLTQAARYSPRADSKEIGEYFARRALEMLVKEIERGSSIPTVQGLLIFSARESACGRTSQGWLYSGMAFRMARDLGMHLAPRKLGEISLQFSHDDLALRQQLFWSCYTWDKTMSLCLGRAPIIADTIDLPSSDTLLDGRDADNEIWQPINIQGTLSESIIQHRALSSMRFAAYCELCIIIHDILDKLYSRPHSSPRDQMLAYLTQTLQKLDDWSSRLPPELLMPQSSKAMLCPPLHILLLNLLHHTTAILLCRPYRAVSTAARERCTKAAQMTDTLFTLHVRRFGFRCITWLQTYTMFVACTINVWDFKESQTQGRSNFNSNLAQEASSRLDFGLEILRQARSTPSAGRCAAILVQLLGNVGGRLVGHQPQPSAQQLTRDELSEISQQPSKHVSVPDPADLVTPSSLAPETDRVNPITSENGQSCVQQDYISLSAECTFPVAPSNFDGSKNTYSEIQGLGESLHVNGGPHRGGIETPFRWLPENVFDDGSWMLTDMDGDLWSTLNGVS